MMTSPLTLTALLERAGKLFAGVEVVSRRPDGSLHRTCYREFHRRACALASALQAAGLQRGDRVATLMWNHSAHLEAYFGVPVAGGVLHTLNLRLHPDELAFIVNHAADRFLIVDDVLLPFFEKIRRQVKFERVLVVPFGCEDAPSEYESYERFLTESNHEFRAPTLDEHDAAAMCYTSGTTGNPKGVVYSHRALALHSFAACMADGFALSRQDSVLPAMSMFHANAWGVPYAAVMAGAKLVFPGPNVQPEPLLDLLEQERITMTGAVPTVWLGVIDALERQPQRWRLHPQLRIISAGSAVPESLFRRFDRFGVTVIQPWGMTETTPIATVCRLGPEAHSLSQDAQYDARARQGTPLPFIDVRAAGESGEVPWDGVTPGELEVRGPWVTASYYYLPSEQRWTDDGWFRTGDVCTIFPDGCIKITDRIKDMIKSGGEWISSVDLENALVGHDAVREAAVIAVPHPKWQERPLAVVVLQKDKQVTAEDLRTYLSGRFAKWQLPEGIAFVEELPHTSTGKLLKTELRRRFQAWKWEGLS